MNARERVLRQKKEARLHATLRPITSIKGVSDANIGAIGKKIVTLWDGTDPFHLGVLHTVHDLECFQFVTLVRRCFEKLKLSPVADVVYNPIDGTAITSYKELLLLPSIAPERGAPVVDPMALATTPPRVAIRRHCDILCLPRGVCFPA